MKYIIHAVPKRIKYIKNHLIPDMEKQGIDLKDILIFNDSNKRGNLQAFLDSVDYIINYLSDEKGIWHLQDDVIISDNFKEETEKANDNIINGFVSKNYNSRKLELIGIQPIKNTWLSFPCVYIPNKYLIGFMNWINKVKDIDNSLEYKKRYESNRHDDFFFYEYIRKNHKKDYVINLNPNIVDHIDYLIGGSINKKRKEQVRGYYFKDLYKIENLEKEISKK